MNYTEAHARCPMDSGDDLMSVFPSVPTVFPSTPPHINQPKAIIKNIITNIHANR